MPFPSAIATDFANEYANIVNMFGQTLLLRLATASATVMADWPNLSALLHMNDQSLGSLQYSFTGFFADPGDEDAELINSLGVGIRIIHALTPPRGFHIFDEVVAPNNSIFTIEAIHPIFINDTIIGNRLFVRG